VIGGCSSHNGCAAIWGARSDYDAWAAAGLTGWSAADLYELFVLANERMAVRGYRDEEVGPFHSACLDAAEAIGIPRTGDLNDLDGGPGIAPFPVNVRDGVRFNAAAAYLDPLRGHANLGIWGDVLVDRLEPARGTHRVMARRHGQPFIIRAAEVVLCAGAYGSPAVLLRSLGIPVALPMRGVGANLHDHPMTEVAFAGSDELTERLRKAAETTLVPEEQTIAKARSTLCDAEFDLHLCPVASPHPHSALFGKVVITAACMDPRSRGRLTLSSADPEAAPLIDHGYLTDPEGHDLEVLVQGVELARSMAAAPALRDLVGKEIEPGTFTDRRSLAEAVRATVIHYFHPVGTCRMGLSGDPDAVVDSDGRLFGVDGIRVADCSIMPAVPRANTNIPAIVVGERIARSMT
jgi:choline dehydrogenase